MKSTSRTTAGILLILSAMILAGWGCSHDNSLEPTSNTESIEKNQAVLVDESTEVGNEPTFVETFDDHINTGSWTFFEEPMPIFEHFEQMDGNPGDWLHCEWCRKKGGLTGRVVELHTQMGVPSVFNGDYRARKVSRVGIDLGFFPYFPMQSDDRPLCLILTNDNGTPADSTDDIIAMFKGTREIPMDNGTWMKYEFNIPSESTVLPKGWEIFMGSGQGADADWNTIITDVSQICYVLGDPDLYWVYDFQLWDIGVDNARIFLDE